MKFLVDRCAGQLLAEWLRIQGYDVAETRNLIPDPGDEAILEWTVRDGRILVTADMDFGELVFRANLPHRGVIRLPHIPHEQRIDLMQQVLDGYSADLEQGAIITIRRNRIRVTRT